MRYDPIAYTYEADTHCAHCAEERFGRSERGFIAENAIDREGNPVGVIAPWDEWADTSYAGTAVLACGTCGDAIETCVVECPECGVSGRWQTTLEDAPEVLVDLGPCEAFCAYAEAYQRGVAASAFRNPVLPYETTAESEAWEAGVNAWRTKNCVGQDRFPL
jgi:hypothetical protein